MINVREVRGELVSTIPLQRYRSHSHPVRNSSKSTSPSPSASMTPITSPKFELFMLKPKSLNSASTRASSIGSSGALATASLYARRRGSTSVDGMSARNNPRKKDKNSSFDRTPSLSRRRIWISFCLRREKMRIDCLYVRRTYLDHHLCHLHQSFP